MNPVSWLEGEKYREMKWTLKWKCRNWRCRKIENIEIKIKLRWKIQQIKYEYKNDYQYEITWPPKDSLKHVKENFEGSDVDDLNR